jgi:hypothetical protein
MSCPHSQVSDYIALRITAATKRFNSIRRMALLLEADVESWSCSICRECQAA